MALNRVRIADVADSLGLSTATVSKVIHGKTEKISDETVKRVQQELERSGYIPNMAGILLARNNSRIIGVVVNDNEKYEGRVLEDGFVMSSLNALSHEVNEKGYFLMIKTTSDISEIPVFALYRVDDSVKALGKLLLIVFALYAPIKVENMILGGGIIRSGGNTKIIMVIDIVGTWCIGIPLCLLAAYVFKWGIVGVYTLLTTEEIFRLVVSLVIFKRRKWMISLS